jgi:beta-lactamase regulating signal transducer with metallopeptidase domain
MVALPVVTAAPFFHDPAISERPPISVKVDAPRSLNRPPLQTPTTSAERSTSAILTSPSAVHWSAVPVLIWLAGVTFFSVRLLRSWIIVERLRRVAVQPVADSWFARMEKIADRLNLSRPLRLVQSPLIDVPMVLGWLRPVILMPISALSGLAPSQFDAIIAHEIAHIRRHDFLINLLQAIAETLLFYHPCTWWLSGRIRVERELCCDEVALTVCEDREAYAQALVELEQLRSPALGLGASSRPLERRIRRIVGVDINEEHRSGIWVAIPLVFAILTIAGQTAYMQVTKGDAVLRGQVLDAATTRPIAGASVTISQRGDLKTVVTNESGRYEVANLEAGEYHVTARANGYVPRAYGQRLTMEEGSPVEIQQGRTISSIDVRLEHSATVHGRIFDVHGNGLPGVEIELLTERYRPGGATLAPVAFAQTEELGVYRVGDLPPGRYYIRAYAPDPMSASAGKKIYASTYLPGTITADQAQSIALSAGQDLFGADMSLATVETVQIEGTLVDPQEQSFLRTTVVLRSPTSRASQAAPVTADGTFRFRDVVPGLYFLVVQEPRCEPSDPPCDARAMRSADRWAGIFEPVEISSNLSGIRLIAGQGARLEGRILVDPTSSVLDTRTLRVIAARHLGSQPNVTEAETIFGGRTVADDGTFTIEHVRGRATLEVMSLPEGWVVKSVRVGNRDVTDEPTDFGDGAVEGIEITVTNRLTQLLGRVSDSRGNGVGSYTVVVFPDDRDRWLVPSRLVRGVRSGSDTLYEIRGLPSGSYLAVAVDSLLMNAWNDPNVLQLLSSSGTPFRLEEGERRVLNLRLSAVSLKVGAQRRVATRWPS